MRKNFNRLQTKRIQHVASARGILAAENEENFNNWSKK